MTDKDLEKAYNLTFNNAKELIEEADGLRIFERYPRAYTLYQLTIEEIGKCNIIYSAILDFYMGTTIDNNYLKKRGFFDHKEKTKSSLSSELIAIKSFEKHIGKETNLSQKVVDDYNNVEEINNKKNQSLYVGLIGDNFFAPSSMITKEMVDGIFMTAHIRWKATEPQLQPLETMKVIAEGVKDLLENPEKVVELLKSSFTSTCEIFSYILHIPQNTLV